MSQTHHVRLVNMYHALHIVDFHNEDDETEVLSQFIIFPQQYKLR